MDFKIFHLFTRKRTVVIILKQIETPFDRLVTQTSEKMVAIYFRLTTIQVREDSCNLRHSLAAAILRPVDPS